MSSLSLPAAEFVRLIKIARHGCYHSDEMGILSFAHLMAGEGQVRLRVADQVAELCVTGKGETDGEIDTLLPMRHLSALARSGKDISIAITDTGAKAKSGRMSFDFPTLESDRLPAVRIQEEIARFTLDLPAMIGFVLPAAGDGVTHQGLDGVALHSLGKRLRIVATNSITLRALSIALENQLSWMVTIPRLTARNIAKLFEGEVETRLCTCGIEVSGGGIEIRSRLLNPGLPPAYEQVLVGPSGVHGKVASAELLEAVETVAPFIEREGAGRSSYILFRVTKDDLLVAAKGTRGIVALAPVPIELQGEVPDFALKAEEILSILRDLRSEKAIIHFHIKSGQCQVLWIEEEGYSDSRIILAPAIGTWPAEDFQQKAA